jgi:hypothetical protein
MRSDKALKEKIIRDGKKLAYPKWKAFFDGVFLLGVFLLVAKLLIIALNRLVGLDIIIPEGLPKIMSDILPLALLIIGRIGSDQLKNKYID